MKTLGELLLVKEMTVQPFVYQIILFRNNYKLITIDLNKQGLDENPEAIQRISFTRNLYQAGNTTMFFILKEKKETILVVQLYQLYCKCILEILFDKNINNCVKWQNININVKLSNLQLDEVKSATKSETRIMLRLCDWL